MVILPFLLLFFHYHSNNYNEHSLTNQMKVDMHPSYIKMHMCIALCACMYVPSYIQGLKKWLEDIVECLQKKPLENYSKQIIAGLFVIYCIGTVKERFQKLGSTFVVSVAKMISFHLKPGQECPEYEIVLNCISPKHRYINIPMIIATCMLTLID